MSIYIEGMEMPKAEFGSMIVAIRPDGMVEDVMGCYVGKAVPVPPHGRLIDADALMLKIREYTEEYGDMDENGWHSDKWCAMQEAKMAIADAPTVIPATEEG